MALASEIARTSAALATAEQNLRACAADPTCVKSGRLDALKADRDRRCVDDAECHGKRWDRPLQVGLAVVVAAVIITIFLVRK